MDRDSIKLYQAVLRLKNDPDFQVYEEYLKQELIDADTGLRKESNIDLLRRKQGKANFITKLLDLPQLAEQARKNN